MFDLSASRKIILSLVTLGIGIMLISSFVARMGNNELFVHNATSNNTSQNKADELAAEIGRHMEELKSDPNNYSTLVHTADLLIQSQQWEAAESFLQRAIAIDNSKAHPYSLLGMALHNLEKNQESAQALEKVVSMTNDPVARYNLTMLYIHFLNDTEKGKVHLLEALKAPDLPKEIKTALEDELKKIQATPSEAKQADEVIETNEAKEPTPAEKDDSNQ